MLVQGLEVGRRKKRDLVQESVSHISKPIDLLLPHSLLLFLLQFDLGVLGFHDALLFHKLWYGGHGTQLLDN